MREISFDFYVQKSNAIFSYFIHSGILAAFKRRVWSYFKLHDSEELRRGA